MQWFRFVLLFSSLKFQSSCLRFRHFQAVSFPSFLTFRWFLPVDFGPEFLSLQNSWLAAIFLKRFQALWFRTDFSGVLASDSWTIIETPSYSKPAVDRVDAIKTSTHSACSHWMNNKWKLCASKWCFNFLVFCPLPVNTPFVEECTM